MVPPVLVVAVVAVAVAVAGLAAVVSTACAAGAGRARVAVCPQRLLLGLSVWRARLGLGGVFSRGRGHKLGIGGHGGQGCCGYNDNRIRVLSARDRGACLLGVVRGHSFSLDRAVVGVLMRAGFRCSLVPHKSLVSPQDSAHNRSTPKHKQKKKNFSQKEKCCVFLFCFGFWFVVSNTVAIQVFSPLM